MLCAAPYEQVHLYDINITSVFNTNVFMSAACAFSALLSACCFFSVSGCATFSVSFSFSLVTVPK